MLLILSPAKSINFKFEYSDINGTEPEFVKEASILIKELRKFNQEEIAQLMKISAKLADLNFERFLKWDKDHNNEYSKPAILSFNGDVYLGLDAHNLNNNQLTFLNNNLRILSGLYGVLKPFDLLREYRLEMGSKLKTSKGDNLYQFWGDKIVNHINNAIAASDGEKVLINLASNEYYKSINQKKLNFPVITPVFKELKDDKYKVVSLFAKKARGMMTRYIAENNIINAEEIKTFNSANYSFNQDLSNEKEWVFTR